MELVLLKDVVAAYTSEWIRVANTQGLSRVQIKDRFREQGFGEGAEELEVEGIDLSPVGGASRIFFRRAANNTKAEVHRLGAVIEQTNAPVNSAIVSFQTTNPGGSFTYPMAGFATVNAGAYSGSPNIGPIDESPEPVKRGRGRPKGSKNRPKPPLTRVTVPTWPNV